MTNRMVPDRPPMFRLRIAVIRDQRLLLGGTISGISERYHLRQRIRATLRATKWYLIPTTTKQTHYLILLPPELCDLPIPLS
ncbi:unnamed protein product [Nezara viridula]|uniref:Uncharacterized protein n=1 Tax=Nezara viridula TaxID=85310 RepID=A0A9P0HHN8_NEZVI|nr:unnamed protein product [Nezara viridula]